MAPRPSVPSPLRPRGRSLSDLGELAPAEKALLDHSRAGTIAIISEDLPSEETSDNTVRAALVRLLALGGDDMAPVHEHGVQLRGAWLTGILDLEEATAVYGILLVDCVIESIEAIQAKLKSLYLNGCRLGGLCGDRLNCAGDVCLRKGSVVTGEVRLCNGRIEGSLDCTGGKFRNTEKLALNCNNLLVLGNVYLKNGFEAIGDVQMLCTTIHGDLDCTGGSFESPERMALSCDRAEVAGRFIFRSLKKLSGGIDVTLMRVGALLDDTASWQGAARQLTLDGFTYARLAGGAPTDAKTRIGWLDSQRPKYVGSDFRPQPWEQLVSTLRSMGHPQEAREVAIAKQRRLGKAKKIPLGARTLHRLHGFFVGYGYKPIRLLVAVSGVWALCALAYSAAADPWTPGAPRLIAPGDLESAPCLVDRGDEACPASQIDYTTFSPLIYSADVLLPIVDLGYSEAWMPVLNDAAGRPLFWGRRLRELRWLEIALGWLLGGVLVAMLGNLIKKD